LLSAVFVTITTTKTSLLLLPRACQLIIWSCVFRPKVVADAPSKKMDFFPFDIFILSQWPFASVYVAHTGFLDVYGNPIFGLYGGGKISKGYVTQIF
jgi:hypothetical protein